ncbi:hypothetical protein L9F63_016770, partial [Diploptera punctata]
KIESNKITIDMSLSPNPIHNWARAIFLVHLLLHTVPDGVTYSFGVFYNEFLKYFNEGRGTTSWIASILVGMTLCSEESNRKYYTIFCLCNGWYFQKPLFTTQHKKHDSEALLFFRLNGHILMFCSVFQHLQC